MKIQWMIPVILGAAISLTGCGKRNDMTIQNDAVPVVQVETTVAGTTVSSTESDTEIVTSIQTGITNRQTAVTKTEISSVTGTTVPAAGAAATAAPQGRQSNANSAGSVSAANTLYGKWETVSFSKDSGERVSYDLSNPVHRSYYVGLDLNEAGQSSLTVGTEGHPATFSVHDNILTVDTVSLNNPVSMMFTVNADRTRMTAELMNGRIIVTLKRINRDFSIRPYENQEPEADFSAIAGDWNYQEESDDSVFSYTGFITVQADGTYIYQPADGAPRRKGTIRAEYEESADGEKNLYFAFYENDSNAMWVRTESSAPNGRGYFSLAGVGTKRLFPWNIQANKYDHYVGLWQSDRCSIQIGREEEHYIVQCIWTTSAAEYNEWIYHCEGDADSMILECTGGGTLVRVTTASDGTETRTEVYNDGTAGFTMNGSKLFWTDNKENVAQSMEFSMPD